MLQNVLTREPHRLKLSDLALDLQYDSGPSPALLAKILRVDTLLFLCNTRFYFQFLSYDQHH
jgi:hypothetical protein